MELISNNLLEKYNKHQKYTLHKRLKELVKVKHQIQPYSFMVSSVFSSMIEGSSLDVEKYILYQSTNNSSTDYILITDLMSAHKFAQSHALNANNILKAHAILSNHFNVDAKYKGHIRDKNVSVGTFLYKVYEGAPKQIVNAEFNKLMADISHLLKLKNLTYNEVFYYASYIHLMLLKVHPFADGNGRISRLVEKWFLSKHLGQDAWLIPSEAYYQINKQKYYANLGIGATYSTIDKNLALDFLFMLPSSFTLSKKRYML
jgi:Fic family protein